MTDRNDRDRKDMSEMLKSLSDKTNNEIKTELLRKELGDFSAMEPEQVAKLLRGWLNSEE